MLISSRENQLVKDAALLVRSAAARRERGLFLAEGERLCLDAVRSGAVARRVFLTAAAAEKWPGETGELRRAAAEVYEITPGVAEKISDTKNPQGVFAIFEIPASRFSAREDGAYVVLAGLQDPGNIGTILRTCEAMGVAGAVVCSSADVWSPKVLRASMGSLLRLPVAVLPDTLGAIAMLKEAGCLCWAAALDEHAVLLPEANFGGKAAVVIGNEGAGLSADEVAACGRSVMIPMPGRAESLNASAAAAILIYALAMKN